jgi:hypothetical protein
MKKQKSNISSTIEDPELNIKRERDNAFSELENQPNKKQRLDTDQPPSSGFSSNFSTTPQPSINY